MSAASEGRIQAQCFQWAWNERPETRRLLCYNLGNSKNRVDGNRNKAKGLIAGRADFSFYWKGTVTFIEMKEPGDGKQSEGQKEWEKLVVAHGFEYKICRSLEDFQEIIDAIIGKNRIL